jgi:hypothetical protein
MSKDIKPQYVSFEIAKLLKEKGFDEFCSSVYVDYLQNTQHYEIGYELDESSFLKGRNSRHESTDYYNIYSAPQQWQVIDWLEINYNITLEARLHRFMTTAFNKEIPKHFQVFVNGVAMNDTYFKSKSATIEEGLLYILKYLI